MFYQSYLIAIELFNQNRVQICKFIVLLVLLIGHLVMASELQHHQSPETDKNGEAMTFSHPLVTQKAPHFEGTAVIDKELKTLSLSQYAGKYVVLLFYALDFSTVCPAEINEYSERLEEFRKLNTVVIACSVDSPYAHLTWLDMPGKSSGLAKVRIPLLSDLSHKISMDYGVYLPEHGHSLQAQFIIDAHGIIRQSTINDLFLSRSVDETLRLIKACRYADIAGVPYPATKSVHKYTTLCRFPF